MLLRIRRDHFTSTRLFRRLSLPSSTTTSSSTHQPAPPVLFFTPSTSRSTLASQSQGRRSFSYESGRGSKGGKKDGDEEPTDPANGPTGATAAVKPVVVEGSSTGGKVGNRRRARRTTLMRSDNDPASRQATLPFTPLMPDHLAHHNTSSLLRDAFFSAGRPLLEVEVPESHRKPVPRATSSEPAKEEGEEDPTATMEVAPPTGAPSDPAFKAPHTSSAVASSSTNDGLDFDALEEDAFGPPDPHAGYLISEPDGPHPSWSRGVTRFLAGCEALVPPRPSQDDWVVEPEDLRTAEEEARRRGRQGEWDEETVKKAAFLAPFGLHPPSPTRAGPLAPRREEGVYAGDALESTLANRIVNLHHHRPSTTTQQPPAPLPTLDQSPHNLTSTAARYLHSAMVSQRFAGAVEWSSVLSKLDHAESLFSGRAVGSLDASTLPGVTGSLVRLPGGGRGRRVPYSPRRVEDEPDKLEPGDVTVLKMLHDALVGIGKQRSMTVKMLGGGTVVEIDLGATLDGSLAPKQLERGGEEHRVTVGGERRGRWVMGRGPRLLRPRWVWTDSVFRKRKRKMNVHKCAFLSCSVADGWLIQCDRYKKRKKARRVMKKRLGK